MEATFTAPVALVRLSYLVSVIYAEVCASHELSVPQAQVMCVLKEQPRGMSEISAMLRLDRSSVTGLVERIERRDYLRRTMSPADRRAVTVSLTPEGKRRTDAFYDEVSERLTELVAALPATDRGHLTRIATGVVLHEGVPDVFGSVLP